MNKILTGNNRISNVMKIFNEDFDFGIFPNINPFTDLQINRTIWNAEFAFIHEVNLYLNN